MVECPKCGGEIREGEASVRVSTIGGLMTGSFGYGMIPIPGVGVPTGVPANEGASENNILWREKTGTKRGLFIKSDEEKTMKVSGHRCIKCGYIELYARE